MTDVLLIDSASRTLQELAESLRIQSHKLYVVNVNSPEKAAQYLRTARFDVIVTDLREQDQDQVKLIHHVGKMYPHTPVIILSAAAGASDGRITRLPFAKLLERNPDSREVAHAILSLS
jgi:DNA-binding NtrC family response regulator